MNWTAYLSLMLALLCFGLYSPVYAKAYVLQSMNNMDEAEFRSSEGNEFKLIKLNRGCRIQARYYLEMENRVFNYTFLHQPSMKQKLLHATQKTFRYHYKNGEEGSLAAVTDIYQHSSEVYKVSDLEVQNEFKKYSALFPITYLNQCN
ncbi:hypothetical protein ACG9ZL_02615 [Acinetobacter sp. ULE_I057]|uniref:hypothetical protein n=1 Tax=Acinetobacter sp. ULE_I057 TaxID=3373070 RepID=UPI003AF8971B